MIAYTSLFGRRAEKLSLLWLYAKCVHRVSRRDKKILHAVEHIRNWRIAHVAIKGGMPQLAASLRIVGDEISAWCPSEQEFASCAQESTQMFRSWRIPLTTGVFVDPPQFSCSWVNGPQGSFYATDRLRCVSRASKGRPVNFVLIMYLVALCCI